MLYSKALKKVTIESLFVFNRPDSPDSHSAFSRAESLVMDAFFTDLSVCPHQSEYCSDTPRALCERDHHFINRYPTSVHS